MTQAQIAVKLGKMIQLCCKHEKKKTQFAAQAAKAGRTEVLSKMESESPNKYLELLDAFCSSATARGRPTEDKRFDWNLITVESGGVKDVCQTVSEFLCESDFVDYYMHKAPAYESHLFELELIQFVLCFFFISEIPFKSVSPESVRVRVTNDSCYRRIVSGLDKSGAANKWLTDFGNKEVQRLRAKRLNALGQWSGEFARSSVILSGLTL